MKTRFFTTVFFSLLTLVLIAGDLDGFWQSTDRRQNIEVIYTHDGIKVRQTDRGNNWESYATYGANRYRDRNGNCFTFLGNILEWCTSNRKNIVNYARVNQGNYSDRNNQNRYDRNDPYQRNDRSNQNDWNDRNWSKSERDSWNNYYKGYEGKWHNHSTGTRITVDLTRRSLRIKFQGERWYEVFERNRGLFVDIRGNEFVFRDNTIEYRAKDGDLLMRFYCDARCDHRDDYRSEYWR